MTYKELIKEKASSTDIQEYLAEDETFAVAIRIPKNFKEASKEFASLKGMSFSAMVRAGLIQRLIEKDL